MSEIIIEIVRTHNRFKYTINGKPSEYMPNGFKTKLAAFDAAFQELERKNIIPDKLTITFFWN